MLSLAFMLSGYRSIIEREMYSKDQHALNTTFKK